MRIGRPEIQSANEETRYQVETSKGPLWFAVQPEFGDFIAASADAALLGLLIPAMIEGEDIRVEGEVSELLHYNLNGRAQSVIRSVLPDLRRVAIEVEGFAAPPAQRPAGVATGFSGGIDSFSAVADHLLSDCNPSFRLTHLLYNEAAALGAPGMFDYYFDRIRERAAPLGLPVIKVSSNLHSFYPDHPTFQQTHSPRNAAIPLVLQRGIGTFYYASGYRYADMHFRPSNDMGYVDGTLVPMLSTEALRAIPVGSERSRVEKTLHVSEHPQSYRMLDVCTDVDHVRNCSKCNKCFRTMLTLDLAGRLDLYREAFDLDEYRRGRDWYIGHVLSANDPLSREIAELIGKTGFKVPLPAQIHRARARVRQAVGR